LIALKLNTTVSYELAQVIEINQVIWKFQLGMRLFYVANPSFKEGQFLSKHLEEPDTFQPYLDISLITCE
jgi:hypothetical protein